MAAMAPVAYLHNARIFKFYATAIDVLEVRRELGISGCLSMYLCICMYICLYIYVYVYIYIRICVSVSFSIPIPISISIAIFIPI